VGDLDVFRFNPEGADAGYLNLTLEGAPFIKQYLSVQNEAGETVFAFDPREAGQAQHFTLPVSGDGDLFFEVSEPTTSVVLVFGSSGSMDGSVEALITAADQYIADKEPHEEMAIVRFNHNVDVLSDFTTDADLLRNAVQGELFADGGTSVYAALFRAVEMLQTREGNRAIVLLSDGADSGDGQLYPELWRELEDAGIRLFIVGLGSGLTYYTNATAASPDKTLQAWAWATGGEFFFAPDSSELLDV
jgi:VWFA-related protein